MIRQYVAMDGLAVGAICLLAAFWATFAIDFVPVMFGLNELSFVARALILTVVLFVFVGILLRMVLMRLLTSLRDESLAILLERKFKQFNESLITTVDSVTRDPTQDEHPKMAQHTQAEAEKTIDAIRVADVLNSRPLLIRLVVAGLLLCSIVLFAVVSPDRFEIARRRIVQLDEVTWPRRCRIELVGIKVKRENPVEGIQEIGQVLTPREERFRIVKGATFTLLVRAESESDTDDQRRLPTNCYLRYWSAQGISGRQTLKRIGTARNGFQRYSFDGQPFAGLLSDISFDLIGGDHRIGPYEIEVVDAPVVINTKLECQFPNYMVDQQSGRWTARTIPYGGTARLPFGTHLKIQCESNKWVDRIYIQDQQELSRMTVLEPDAKGFQFELNDLAANRQYHIYLCDRDGIISEQPHVISIESIEDQAPTVQTRLKGIGSAITPDAMIPLEGSIVDDYGVQRTWLEIETPVTEPIQQSITPESNGALTTVFDFRQRRQSEQNSFTLPSGVSKSISVTLKTVDHFDLGAQANTGVGDRYVLEIVSPGRLLRILERAEVGQRRRLEQIFGELNDARQFLVRAGSKLNAQASGFEPGDETSNDPSVADSIKRDELRLLFSQRAGLQIAKSQQEIAGVADLFDNIRLQLINNRVDSKDRKTRLATKVILPLRHVAEQSMPDLRQKITALEKSLQRSQNERNNPELAKSTDMQAHLAVQQVDQLLLELDRVLGALVKYETQNELLDIVRQMIEKQKEILERTKKERQNKAFDSIFD